MAKKPNDQLVGHSDILDVVLLEKDGVQFRLSVTEFRESNYLSIREWYMSFEEEWMPTRNGMTLPYDVDSVYKLFNALTGLLSKAEVLEVMERYRNEDKLS